MDTIPAVAVRVSEGGALLDVNVEGQATPTVLVGTRPSGPTPHFGDQEFTDRVRPWLVAG